MMLRIELNNEMTKFLREDQYFVTLKILKSRKALRTESPKEPAKATILVQHTRE